MNITVLIPTYMEYENLKRLLPLLYTKVYPQLPRVHFSTLVIDDNSPDGTERLVRDLSKKYSHLHLSLGKKQGIGAAMKRGYSYALRHLRPTAIATLEADFVVHPQELVTMIEKLSKRDVVLVSRKAGADSYGDNNLRRLMHLCINTVLCGLVMGMTQVREHTAACRLIRVRGILERIDTHALPNGYTFFAAQLAAVLQCTDKVIEHETPFYERTKGESKMTFLSILRDSLNYCDLAIKIRLQRNFLIK